MAEGSLASPTAKRKFEREYGEGKGDHVWGAVQGERCPGAQG